MAKKKGGGRRQAAAEEEDAASIASGSTAYSHGGGAALREDIDDEVEAFQTAIDDTYESRVTTREKAWEALNGMLRSELRYEDCAGSGATLIGRALNSIRKGGALEAQLAASAIGLCFLTLGEPDERAFDEVQPELERAAKHGKSVPAKQAALEALALSCWVAAEDERTTLATMQAMRWHWRRDSPKLQAAAVRAWSLLFTSLGAPLGAAAVDDALAAMSQLLHGSDVEVRGAAGEAIALLYHSAGLADISEEDEEEDEEEEEAAGQEAGAPGMAAQVEGMSNGASTSASGLEQLEQVLDRMRDLATNRGDRQRRSRRERATLRTTFRGLSSVLGDGGAPPAQKIKLQHGDVLVVDSLRGGVLLSWLRHFLGGGFQAHLQHNPLLHSVFDHRPAQERAGRLTALEKRLFRSPGSAQNKARAQQRKQQRSYKGGTGGGEAGEGAW